MLVFMILGGCSSRSAVTPVPPAISSSYLLQHSGVLTIANKRMPLRGMLQLNPAQRNARVVLLNDMGMKLLVAEITAGDAGGFESKELFSSPFLRMIPHFYDESMHCIYEMFLAPQHSAFKRANIITKGKKIIGKREFAVHTIINDPQGRYTLELFLNSGSIKDF